VCQELNAADVLLVECTYRSMGWISERELRSIWSGKPTSISRRNYSASVAECRRAIDSLWTSAGLTDDAGAAKTLGDVEGADIDDQERRLVLGEAIRIFSHSAHHVGSDAEPEVFSRLDAALAVAATAGLISSLASSEHKAAGPTEQ
jgi:hypothetical protein